VASTPPPSRPPAGDELARVADELFAERPVRTPSVLRDQTRTRDHTAAPTARHKAAAAPARRDDWAASVDWDQDALQTARHELTPAPPARSEPEPPSEPVPARPARPAPSLSAASARERAGDWLLVTGGILLFLSLFMPWSHQLSGVLLRSLGGTPALHGVPGDPNAWQIYSTVDVLLALLAVALLVLAGAGSQRARLIVGGFVVAAIVFTVHALGSPPATGTSLVAGALAPVRYLPAHPAFGSGEVVALLSLLAALAGIAVSAP
jgi:hypothetical protein